MLFVSSFSLIFVLLFLGAKIAFLASNPAPSPAIGTCTKLYNGTIYVHPGKPKWCAECRNEKIYKVPCCKKIMIRRLGDATFYRAESPSQNSMRESEISIDYSQNDEIDRASCNTVIADPWPESPQNLAGLLNSDLALVTRGEISKTERNLCKKLSLIVDLVADFAADANKLAESADELLKELRTKIRVYINFLDVEMVDTEQLLRFNVDRSSICDDRIDWLLHYTKCHKEMRRVLFELSEEVCDDLEACLEQRNRGVPGKKPAATTLRTLSEMQKGMEMAGRILGNSPRQRA